MRIRDWSSDVCSSDLFGLNDRQIEILARATPKRDYHCQSRRGNRLFELGLSDVALALCAASAKTDQAAVAKIIAEHGLDDFLARSEEHTSELQSLMRISYAVFCLKKKK